MYVNKKYYLCQVIILTDLTFENMNVGLRIKNVLMEKGLSANWLAGQIPCERSNVYNIFRRESINVDLLFVISTLLEHNFFKELSDEFEAEE